MKTVLEIIGVLSKKEQYFGHIRLTDENGESYDPASVYIARKDEDKLLNEITRRMPISGMEPDIPVLTAGAWIEGIVQIPYEIYGDPPTYLIGAKSLRFKAVFTKACFKEGMDGYDKSLWVDKPPPEPSPESGGRPYWESVLAPEKSGEKPYWEDLL